MELRAQHKHFFSVENGELQPPVDTLRAISCEVRKGVFESVKQSDSGHLGGPSSSVELLVALYFGDVLNYDIDDPQHPDRDRVLIRGHLGPSRYKIFSLLGWIPKEDLSEYRQLGGLQGHEEMDLTPGVDITPTGSLGMVLSYGAGCALAANNLEKSFTTYVFLGDGEEQEGSVSEAARHIAALGLDNIICILDRNGKQLSRPTDSVDVADIKQIWEGYGWDVEEIENGNDIELVVSTLSRVKDKNVDQPRFIIANTTKGFGIPGAEDHFCGYHSIGSCPEENLTEAIQSQESQLELLGYNEKTIYQEARRLVENKKLPPSDSIQEDWKLEVNLQPGATDNLELIGEAGAILDYRQKLSEIFKKDTDGRLYSMTADLCKMELIDKFGFHPPIVHIDTGVREQHLLAMAYGLSLTDPNSRIFINYADCILYRGADQINSIAIGNGRMIIIGERGGLSGARDGSTHESFGQPGMLTTMPGLRLFEPADVLDLYNCLNKAFSEYKEPTYVRIHSLPTPLLEREETDKFSSTFYEVGEREEESDIVLVSCGMTAHGSVEAKKLLNKYSIKAKLINVVDMKSLNRDFVDLLSNDVPVLTVYNGNEYILRSAVTAAVMDFGNKRPSQVMGHGFEGGTSGSIEELMSYYRLDGEGIVEVLRENFPEIFDR